MKPLLALVSCGCALLAGCVGHAVWDDSPAGQAARNVIDAKNLYNTEVRPYLSDRGLTGGNDVGLSTSTSEAFMVKIAGRGIKEGRYWFEPRTNAWEAVQRAGGLSTIASEVDLLRGTDSDTPSLIACETSKSAETFETQLARITLQKGDLIYVQLPVSAERPPDKPFNPFLRP